MASRALAAAETGQGLFIPDLHRLHAALARARGDTETARARLQRARMQAMDQGAAALVARIDRDLGAD
jgi:hypothetical protein